MIDPILLVIGLLVVVIGFLIAVGTVMLLVLNKLDAMVKSLAVLLPALDQIAKYTKGTRNEVKLQNSGALSRIITEPTLTTVSGQRPIHNEDTVPELAGTRLHFTGPITTDDAVRLTGADKRAYQQWVSSRMEATVPMPRS